MKITEVRNNLFGLEDLKGLISENRPGEWDWPGFFDQDPTRQDIHFNELMGLKSWLEKNGIKNLSSPAANSLLASLTPEQIEDIKLIFDKLGEQFLDDKTLEAATYRMKYPESSLQELSEIIAYETNRPITKSGLNHRFRKIKEIANRLRSDEK